MGFAFYFIDETENFFIGLKKVSDKSLTLKQGCIKLSVLPDKKGGLDASELEWSLREKLGASSKTEAGAAEVSSRGEDS